MRISAIQGRRECMHNIYDYTWKGMKCDVEYFVSICVKCQKFKKTAQKKYAKLPLRDDIASEPFHTLQVDLIGLWNVEIKQANSRVINIQLKALTVIDVGTFLLEIVPHNNKKSSINCKAV